MKPVSKRFAAVAVAALAAGTITACGSSGSSAPSASSSGKPVSGGTLNMVSAGDFDHVRHAVRLLHTVVPA